MYLAEKIVKLRKEKGWSQEELAAVLSGIVESLLSLIKKDDSQNEKDE